MEFGYPGANTHLENHGVSEESFWPSFTDIMMVIVMVFLMVTVAVILNNWSLIGELKNSIQAQQVASSLAENRQVENASLGSKLTTLEKQIVLLNEKYEQEKTSLLISQKTLSDNKQALSASQQALDKSQQALIDNQEKLSASEQQIEERDTALVALQTQLKTLNDNLAAEKSSLSEAQLKLTESKQQLTEKETALVKLQTDLTGVMKQKEELAELNKTHNNAIAESEKEQQNLQQALISSKSTIASLEEQQKLKEKKITDLQQADEIKTQVLASLQTDRSKLEKSVSLLKSDYKKSQQTTKDEIALSKEIKSKLEALKKSQLQQKESILSATNSETMVKDALQASQDALKDSEEEKQRIIVAMNEKIIESDKKVTSLEASINKVTEQVAAKDTQIKEKEEQLLALQDNSQLLSLQGKYDTLDKKYQKLLRPARSSNGKFIVSVTYKNKGGKRIIRLKPSPTGSYKTVSKKQLHKTLAKLKAKHKTDLYMKVIIPETSGLSYSEAWKFTSNLQKKYDYYHQPDKSK
jgi:DNA repair exonuclease SbcCD ATPase subunit